MKRLVGSVLALVLLTSVLTGLASQLKVDVALVNVVATVTDRNGRYVSLLGPEDFIVTEDGEPQEIAHFSHSDETPVSVGIALDTSGSMESRILTASNAVERFIRTIHEDDDIFLLTFANRTRLNQGFTDDRNRLASALRRVSVGGGTALYDAVDESLSLIREGKHSKRALLLITDGEDTNSYLDFEDAASAVRRSELLVYSLGISSSNPVSATQRVPTTPPIIIGGGGRFPTGGISIPGWPGGNGGGGPIDPRLPPSTGGRTPTPDSLNMDVLETFAASSGGRAWLLSGSWNGGSSAEIDDILDQIAAELRNQYSIGYYPAHGMKDGKWHRVEIRTRDSRYRVRARKDYFAGKQ